MSVDVSIDVGKVTWGFPSSSDGKESACNAGDAGLIPGSGRSPAGGHGNPLLFLPGKSHGQRSLAGCSPQRCKEMDNTELTEHARMQGYLFIRLATY